MAVPNHPLTYIMQDYRHLHSLFYQPLLSRAQNLAVRYNATLSRVEPVQQIDMVVW